MMPTKGNTRGNTVSGNYNEIYTKKPRKRITVKTLEVPEDWNIVPAHRNEKRPLEEWKEYQTIKYPRERLLKLLNQHYNIGVITGKISAPDGYYLIVVDFDDITNIAEFGRIFDIFTVKHPDIGETRIEKTQSGNLHVYFYVDEELRNTKYTDLKYDFIGHIDTRGEGGFSVISPSSINGRSYEIFKRPDKITKISKKQFDIFMDYFANISITEEPQEKKVERSLDLSAFRLPIRDMILGKIDIKKQSVETGNDEHIYWKYIYSEADRNNMRHKDLFPLLQKNQPEFNMEKTLTQLKYHKKMPMARDNIEKYFPGYISEKIKQLDPNDIETVHDILRIIPKNPLYCKKYLLQIKTATDFTLGDLTQTINHIQKVEVEEIPIEQDIAETILEEKDYSYNNKWNMYLIQNGLCIQDAKSELEEDIGKEIRIRRVKNFAKTANDVENYIRYIKKFDEKTVKYDGILIPFKNGYYDIKQDKFIDKEEAGDIIFPYQLPHDYIEDYEYDENDLQPFYDLHDGWFKFTPHITTDFTFQAWGYSMNLDARMKAAYACLGKADSGKTTYMKILKQLTGYKNTAGTSLQRLGKGQFGLAHIQLRPLIFRDDQKDGKIEDLSIIKMMIGGDIEIEVEPKYKEMRNIRYISKIWFNANKAPIVTDDPAFFIRFIVIEFKNKFEKNEYLLEDVMNDHLIQCLLHECVKGLRKLYENGMKYPKEIRENSAHIWKMNADSVYRFYHERLIKDSETFIEAEELYNVYLEFFADNCDGEPLTKTHMRSSLLQEGILRRRKQFEDDYGETKRKNVYLGIRYRTESDEKSIYSKFEV